jgi:hypothetical protein
MSAIHRNPAEYNPLDDRILIVNVIRESMVQVPCAPPF